MRCIPRIEAEMCDLSRMETRHTGYGMQNFVKLASSYARLCIMKIYHKIHVTFKLRKHYDIHVADTSE